MDVKFIIHSHLPNDDNDPHVRSLYLKSHHDYLPGQRKLYGYEAPAVKHIPDAMQNKARGDGAQAKACMTWTPEE